MLMQRRLAAKKKGRKVKTNRCHMKDGHLRCQAKQPMTKADTATFYKTMFGLGEEGTETEPVEEDVEEEEVLVEVLRAAPEGQQKSVQKKKKETKKKEKKRKSAVRKDNEEIVETKNKKRRRMQESAEDQDTEAAVPSPVVPGPALDGNGIGDEEAARAEDRETQEAAGPALAGDMGDNTRCAGVKETAPSRPEENEEEAEAKKSAPEEGEKEEAAPAPVK